MSYACHAVTQHDGREANIFIVISSVGMSLSINHVVIDISYAAPQAHEIINAALHREYSRYRIYIFPREEGSLSCLRLTQRATPMSTTRLYRGYVNWG
jgi:hypothetical protein